MDSQRAILCNSHMNARLTLTRRRSLQRILPPGATSRRQAKMIKHVKFAEIAGGPHGLCWTHADRVNAELVSFVE
jgi:non-heme chloroperoxidase